MRVNNDCIKAVLNHVIDNTSIKCDTANCTRTFIDLSHIIKGLEGNYSKETIVHSAIYAQLCGYFIVRSVPDTLNFNYSSFLIIDVSPVGYRFLDNK